MIRKFRRIFRSPSKATASKTETNPPANTSNSLADELPHHKQQLSPVNNHSRKGTSNSPGDDTEYAKMRIISSPNLQLRDIIRALLASSSPSSDLFSPFLTYGQLIGASSLHGYLVDHQYQTETLISEEFSSYQGAALCITYDTKLTDQQWEEIFGIHESNSTLSKKTSSFFHFTDFLCILSGSRVVYYDPNERMVNEERAYVSIFDLETDDIDIFEDQLSPFEYFLSGSKTFYNGTILRLPLRTRANQELSSNIQTLDELKQELSRYFSSVNSSIEYFLIQSNLQTVKFDYTKDMENFSQIIRLEKQVLGTIEDLQSRTDIIQLISNINDPSRWIFSTHQQTETELKFLLPLNSLNVPIPSNHFHSFQITPSRLLYYSLNPLSTADCSVQFSRIQFPRAYALFLKDLSRLIKPISIGNLSIDLIWELMPDVDQYHKDAVQSTRTIEKYIPQIWEEIGKQELFYSVTEGWGYVAIEDMIINNVESGPIQDVLTYVFSEANAPIVILPTHVINGLCKYSNKHYLQVMTPFHASELLAKNSALLSRLTFDQKLALLKYIILNDPDPGLVLELELLPLANQTFTIFQTKQASSCVYIVDRDPEFLRFFPSKSLEKFLNPKIDENLFEKLSSQNFQGKHHRLR